MIPDVSKKVIERAMEEFDRNLRDTPGMKNWESNANQFYAVKWKRRRYPPKVIISLATGLPRTKLHGGEASSDANNYLRKRRFKIIKFRERDPKWVRDELILALDFYLRHKEALPSKSSREIRELSNNLRRLGEALGQVRSDKYRNPNGTYMKLMNFLRLDPDYTSGGKVGLSRGGKEEKVVWAKYAHDPALCHKTAAAILANLKKDTASEDWADEEDEEEAEEGKLLTRIHRSRERNRKIVNRKKKQVLRKKGELLCECCGFDFAVVYGERGEGFIECHHKKPVADLKPGTKTRLDDLALVCANCHRIIHRKKPWLTIVELKQQLNMRAP